MYDLIVIQMNKKIYYVIMFCIIIIIFNIK